MKNYIKKILTIVGMTVAALVPAVSFAATLNNASNDFATLRVTNYTVNPTCTTCWATSVNANAGNVVSFYVYYHNTGVDTAKNVRVRLSPQVTGNGTTQTFTAIVSADNAPAVTGIVTVTTSSNQTISYISGQTIWRPNQTQFGSSALLFGQSGAELFNGVGLNLGDIAPGWSTQGGVAVRFQVSNNTTNNNGGGSYGLATPTVSTQGATGITGDSASLIGYADPAGTSDTVRWFEWGTSASFGYQSAHTAQGVASGNFSTPVSGLVSNTTYYYRAVAQNAQGTVYGNTLSFVTVSSNNNNNCTYNCNNNNYNNTATVSSLSANPSTESATLTAYVDPRGTSDTVRWFEWGTLGSLSNQTARSLQGVFAGNFSATIFGLTPNTTYSYRAVAQNSQGTVYGNTLSFVSTGTTYASPAPAYGIAPAAATLLPTEVTAGTAKLNGLVFTTSAQSSNAWFEWGDSVNLGGKTTTVNVGALPAVKHDAMIYGLVWGHTYYYRIVAENSYGKSYGTTVSFVARPVVTHTTTTTVIHRPVTTTTTNTVTTVRESTSTQALAMLVIDGGSDTIGNGEKRSYHVTWKNTSGADLKNVVVRITLPASMSFDSATSGSYSATSGLYGNTDNTVTVGVGTLAAGATGEIFVVGTTASDVTQGQLLVVTANMVYTSLSNVQGDVVAYVTHHVERTQTALGASVFGLGAFLPTTLFGWMILVILVLILVLLGNHVYGRFSDSTH
jgi:uncharacterized repeat protein (TIGR01451 family)